MPAFINHLVTGVPVQRYEQSFVRDFLKKHLGDDRRIGLAIHHIYKNSGIDYRHSVIRDFDPKNTETGLFYDPVTASLTSPGTAERNQIYELEARTLFTDLARKIISETPGVSKSSITHVITVSCTGFYAPGPDLDIVTACELNPSVQRYHIGFMGCYAAFPALRMAKTICLENPAAHVLIVAVELCTLHLKFNTDADSLISTSVFADGGAAAIVTGSKEHTRNTGFELGSMQTHLVPKGAGDMAWTIGNNGFDMVLSSYIPDILSSGIKSMIEPLMETAGLTYKNVHGWAIHPGGRAIIDKIATELQLEESAIEPSRLTLSRYGNMSSATILFVLNEWRNRAEPDPKQLIAMAFGPGLTVELGALTLFQE
jgi:predicted naringenin-chalcone synthase